jgi:putative ABC transport system ATP-binding protein
VGVTRRFHTSSGDVLAVDRVDIAVRAGRLTVVRGPSGSGKSTLLGVVACMDRVDAGTVEVDGIDVTQLSRRRRRALRRRRIGIVLPQPSDNLLTGLDATENVEWSRRVRGRGDDLDLTALGLAGSETKRVLELSGGEQQRVALACALAGDPILVVCDEPTASLDRDSARLVVDALRRAVAGGATVLVATHDADVIAAADDLVSLDHGRRV